MKLNVFACSLALLAFCQQLSAQTKILCVGDSITMAPPNYNSYRRALWQRLVASGAAVDFIGTQTMSNGGPPPNPDFDLDHEGHWGWRADQILGSLPTWLGTYTPDIVLLHIGSNDALLWDGGFNFVAQTVGDIEGTIRVLQNDNPNVIVLLAKLIPVENRLALHETAWNDHVNALNDQIPGIAARMATTASKVIVVDQNTGFSASADTSDGIHPNVSGETKMANKWFDAINAVLRPPQATAFANGSFEQDYANWTASGNQGVVVSGTGYTSTDGAKLVVFNWGQTAPNGSVSQTFTTTAGQNYTLTFSPGVVAYNFSEQRMQVTVQGSSTLLSQTISMFGLGSGITRWFPQTFTFTANTTSTTVSFRDVSPGTQDLDLLLDKVGVTTTQSQPPPPPPINNGVPANLSFESDYAGWTATGNQGIGSTGSAYTANDGSKLVVFNWGQTSPNGVLSQRFSTVRGQAYTVGFQAGIVAYNRNEQRLQVTIEGSSLLASKTVSLFASLNGVTTWLPQTLAFTADSDTTILTFRDVSPTTQDLDLLLDAVRVEAGNAPAPPSIGVNLGFEAGYSGWTATGNQGVGTSGFGYTSSEGVKLVVFNWGQTTPNGSLVQNLPTGVGQTYQLTFDAGVVAYNSSEQRMQVTVQGSGTLLSRTISLFGVGNGTTRWLPQSFQFTANTTTTILTFRDASPTSLNLDLLLDNVRITPTSAAGLASLRAGRGASTVPLASDLSIAGGADEWSIRYFAGSKGHFQLEHSSDLLAWVPIGAQLVNEEGWAEFTHSPEEGMTGFYRVVPLTAEARRQLD